PAAPDVNAAPRGAPPGAAPLARPAGLCADAGGHEMHEPVLGCRLVRIDAPAAQLDAEAARQVLVVEEVRLDQVALVAERQNELTEAEVPVKLHDVPEDRPTADLHHRLRLVGGRLLPTGYESPEQ